MLLGNLPKKKIKRHIILKYGWEDFNKKIFIRNQPFLLRNNSLNKFNTQNTFVDG